MYMCVNVFLCASTQEGQKRVSDPLSWGYRHLRATQHVC